MSIFQWLAWCRRDFKEIKAIKVQRILSGSFLSTFLSMERRVSSRVAILFPVNCFSSSRVASLKGTPLPKALFRLSSWLIINLASLDCCTSSSTAFAPSSIALLKLSRVFSMQMRKKAITIECDSQPWLFYLYNLYIEVKGLACKGMVEV